MIFYSNLSNLSEKIQKFAKDDTERKKIAERGKKKYMKYFNSTIVADYIINNTFEAKYKKNKDFCKEKFVLAISKTETTISVAMYEPEDMLTIDAIKNLTNGKFEDEV